MELSSDGGTGEAVTAPRMQRSAGRGAVSAALSAGRSRLRRNFQEGCVKIRLPAAHGGGALEAVLINTSGGLTGGDRLRWEAAALEGASLVATTPAHEKIYRSAAGEARVDVTLSAGPRATLAWLPQETLMFDGGRLIRTLEADLAADARFVAVESVLLGRLARGETMRSGLFRDRWRVRRSGELIHAEEVLLEGDMASGIAAVPGLDGAAAFATILLAAGDAPERLNEVRALLPENGGGTWAGASAWGRDGAAKLLVRMVAPDGYALRKALVPVLCCLAGGGVPRIWST